MNLNLHQLPALKETKSIVILLHGYGADGKDLLDLGQVWQRDLPNTLFVSPDAPQRCDGNPMGFQWYPLHDVSPPAVVEGTTKASYIIAGLIDKLLTQHSVPANKIVLAGFSQGAMTSLFTALHYRQQLAGVVAYSGLLAISHPPANMEKPPVLLVHGEQDAVVPVSGSKDAHKNLKDWGVESELVLRPNLEHGIDREGLEKALEKLRVWLA